MAGDNIVLTPRKSLQSEGYGVVGRDAPVSSQIVGAEL